MTSPRTKSLPDSLHTCIFPSDTFPRYRYFRQHVFSVRDRTDSFLGNFKLEGATMDSIRKGISKLKDEITIVIIGENRHLVPLDEILEKHHGGCRLRLPEKEDTHEYHLLGSGDTVGAFILPLTDPIPAKDLKLLKQLNKRFGLRLLQNLILVETQPGAHCHRRLASLFLDLFDEDVNRHSCRFIVLDKLYSSISSHLEATALDQVLHMENALKKNLENLPIDLLTKESIVSSSSVNPMSITSLLDGWILELADDRWLPGSLGDLFEELHNECNNTDVRVAKCKVCYLVYRLSSWESSCLESCLHHTIMMANKGFKGLMEDGNLKAETRESMKTAVIARVVHCMKSKFKKLKDRCKRLKIKPTLTSRPSRKGSSHLEASRTSFKVEEQTKTSTNGEQIGIAGARHHSERGDKESNKDDKPRKSENDVAVHFVKGAIIRNKKELISALLAVYKTVLEEAFNFVKEPWLKDGFRLHWEVTGLLEESNVVDIKQRLQQVSFPDGILMELLKSIREVQGCGVCYGKLRVDLEKEAYRHDRDNVSKKVQQFFIDHSLPDIEYDVAEASPVHKLCHIGVPIRAECPNQSRQGTLGGFATIDKSEGNPKLNSLLCALASRHVVQDANKISVLMNKETYLDIDRIVGVGKGEYDIAAISIEGQKGTKFNISFKNSDGEDRDCHLFDFTTFRRLNGKPVHIWGAKSQPGRGKIKCPSYSKRGDDGECYNYVLIEDDQSSGAPFSQEGDSGAIVVADTPEDDHVLALSMLFGRAENGEYHSFRLIDGLRSLKDIAGIHKITIHDNIV